MDKILHFIDGQYSPSASDRWMYKINPATGEKTADIALGDQTDVQRAVDASAQALTSWSATSRSSASEILNRIAEIISQRSEMLAAAETTDTGKPSDCPVKWKYRGPAAISGFLQRLRFSFPQRVTRCLRRSIIRFGSRSVLSVVSARGTFHSTSSPGK